MREVHRSPTHSAVKSRLVGKPDKFPSSIALRKKNPPLGRTCMSEPAPQPSPQVKWLKENREVDKVEKEENGRSRVLELVPSLAENCGPRRE